MLVIKKIDNVLTIFIQNKNYMLNIPLSNVKGKLADIVVDEYNETVTKQGGDTKDEMERPL